MRREVLLAAFLACLLAAGTGWAHKVRIFAFASGDEVICRGSVGRGGKSKNCRVRVYLPDGKLLAEGRTDDNGRYRFKPGVRAALRIVLDAGEGHGAEFMLEPKGLSKPSPAPTQAQAGFSSVPPPPTPRKSTVGGSGLDEAAVRRIVDQALDEKLEPIYDELAALADRGPGITEIIGGIGYILGLMGTVAYFRSRANLRKPQDRP